MVLSALFLGESSIFTTRQVPARLVADGATSRRYSCALPRNPLVILDHLYTSQDGQVLGISLWYVNDYAKHANIHITQRVYQTGRLHVVSMQCCVQDGGGVHIGHPGVHNVLICQH